MGKLNALTQPHLSPGDAQGIIQDLRGIILVCGVIRGRRRSPRSWFRSRLLSSTLHLLARLTSSSATSA